MGVVATPEQRPWTHHVQRGALVVGLLAIVSMFVWPGYSLAASALVVSCILIGAAQHLPRG